MAYGRLDVFYPDGNFRSFPLKEGKVSVGRSPGNTITLETETISRYHFSITNENGEIRLADMESQNGTYMDGVKIPDGESVLLRGGEEILAGQLRIIYHEVDEIPTQPVRPDGDITQRVEKQDVPFQLSVQPPPIAIPPGAHAAAELTITNTGEKKGFFNVEVDGIERNWIRIDRPKLMLDADESAQVIINIRPVRRSETVPGEYPVKIAVYEEDNPADRLEVTTHVHVLPYGGFGVALERKVLKQNERFRLHLHNQGSAPLPLSVGGSDRFHDVNIDLVSSSQVVLQPGQRLVMQGVAKPSKPKIVGTPEVKSFDIVVRSQEANHFIAVVRGSVTQQPFLPPVVLAVLAGGFILMLVLGVIFATMLSSPTPEIVSLQVNATSVPRGEPLQLSWEASDITSYEIRIDETPIASLNGDVTSYILETDDLPASPIISVVGKSRGRDAQQEQFILVYDPMQINAFNVQPPELIRYVVQPISLEWEVANASFVQITGLDAFTTGDVPGGRFDPVDNIEDVIGLPLDNLTITLYAEDNLGNSLTDQLVVPAVVPQCTPLDEQVILRSGPNPLNQQVATVPIDRTVDVDARDVSGAWVRVKLDGGLTGWGALDEFTCSDRFNPAELRQEINVTPPPQQPTEPPPSPTTSQRGTPAPVTPTPGQLQAPSTPFTPQPTASG